MGTIPQRVEGLRRLMERRGLEAYVVPSTDPHQSEYVPDLWKRREFLSGFTGSAGDVVVGRERAGLWTDSRYWLQAEQEIDSAIFTLYRSGRPGVPGYPEWLASLLGPGERAGVDPRLLSYRAFESLASRLERHGAELVAIEENLVDAVWEDRPASPRGKAVPHEERFAGESVAGKLERVRRRMEQEGASALAVTALDDVAWLFNLRGSDVAYNPVAIACALVTTEDATLYLDAPKIGPGLPEHLGDAVAIRPYGAFEEGLRRASAAGMRVWIDPVSCNRWVAERLGPQARLLVETSPIPLFKARKNPVELRGAGEAHLRDGVAMVRFLRWLEETLRSSGTGGGIGGGEATEIGVARKLVELRSRSDLFRGPSFATIAGYGPHGAVIHYEATPESDAAIRPEGILLVDSGGQYLDGTTDITRTIALGEPSAEVRERFTRVLQGVVRLSALRFPAGTAGRQIDAVARLALWEIGLNFGHGVGHGIGSYLNVHEGPQAISYYRCTGTALEPGMLSTIEPGYYEEGKYGIRTENVVVVEEAEGAPGFLTFRTLTLCPVDRRLVEPALLAPPEIAWLDAYHARVRERLSPRLDGGEAAWLAGATRPLAGD